MNSSLRNMTVAIGLAFGAAAFTGTEAEACKITVYALKDKNGKLVRPLQNVPKEYEKYKTGHFWQEWGGDMANHPSVGPYKVSNSFTSLANACGKYANDLFKQTKAGRVVWELPSCSVGRSDGSPQGNALLERDKRDIKAVCRKKHTLQ